LGRAARQNVFHFAGAMRNPKRVSHNALLWLGPPENPRIRTEDPEKVIFSTKKIIAKLLA